VQQRQAAASAAAAAGGSSGYALAARALSSRFALRSLGSDFALAAQATHLRLELCPSQLVLCARGLSIALAACALPLQLGICPYGSRCEPRGQTTWGGGSIGGNSFMILEGGESIRQSNSASQLMAICAAQEI
jgi:hypothetical protein